MVVILLINIHTAFSLFGAEWNHLGQWSGAPRHPASTPDPFPPSSQHPEWGLLLCPQGPWTRPSPSQALSTEHPSLLHLSTSITTVLPWNLRCSTFSHLNFKPFFVLLPSSHQNSGSCCPRTSSPTPWLPFTPYPGFGSQQPPKKLTPGHQGPFSTLFCWTLLPPEGELRPWSPDTLASPQASSVTFAARPTIFLGTSLNVSGPGLCLHVPPKVMAPTPL